MYFPDFKIDKKSVIAYAFAFESSPYSQHSAKFGVNKSREKGDTICQIYHLICRGHLCKGLCDMGGSLSFKSPPCYV